MPTHIRSVCQTSRINDEQIKQSNTVDHRADIYSLGVVSYELLTGEIPAGAFEPPSQRASIDGRLDAVVMRTLATDPERRFQSAQEIGSHISGLSNGPVSHLSPEQAHWPGPSTMIDNGVAAVAAGIRDVFHPVDMDEEDPQGNTFITLPRAQIEQDHLPDVCMVCGKSTKRRVTKEFQYTSDTAGWIIFLLIVLFFPLGILVAILSTKKVRVSCPVCTKHKRHWSKLVWFASTGWIIVVGGVFTGLTLFVAFGSGFPGPPRNGADHIARQNVPLLLAWILGSAALYVIPLIWLCSTRVSVAEINAKNVTFQQVSTAFANAARAIGFNNSRNDADSSTA